MPYLHRYRFATASPRCRLFSSLLFASVALSCAWVRVPRPHAAAHSARCGSGVDYGSGMVAVALPDAAAAAITEQHDLMLSKISGRQSEFLREAPYAPHVSLLYGITDEKVLPAVTALRAFLQHTKPLPLHLGKLHYWDDLAGGKTTVVVEVLESEPVLAELHNTLAVATQVASRFAYHPHITLGYLTAGDRLDESTESALMQSLQRLAWVAETYFITDPCGQRLVEQRTGEP